MAHLWNGSPLFGSPTRSEGPGGPMRLHETKLPGVNGGRVYVLGRDPWVWKISGRLSGFSLSAVKTAIKSGIAAANGSVGTFTDSDGSAYANCILKDFRTAGDFEGMTDPSSGAAAVTVEITANIEWLSPTF